MHERLLQRKVQANKPITHKPDILPSEKPKLSEVEQTQLDNQLLGIAGDDYRTEECIMATIKRLLKAGADIAATSDYGLTTLHCAAYEGHTKVCRLIIQRYAEAYGNVTSFIAAKDSDGKTAIQHAIDMGCTETAQFLRFKLLEPIFGDKRTSLFFMKSFGDCLAAH